MDLSVSEQFLLLAHHPVKGRFLISEVMMSYGLAGAFLLELNAKDKITLRDSRLIVKSRRENDRILSEILSILSQANKPKKLSIWIRRIARKSGRFKKRLLQQLATKKCIIIRNKTFLGFIHYRKYNVKDQKLRNRLIETLRNAILNLSEIKPELIPLLGLAEACKMYRILGRDKNERKRIKNKLHTMVTEMPAAEILDETIREVQAVIIGSITAGTVATVATY